LDGRAKRVDAQRNRELILDVAAKTFSEHGLNVPLDKIAKKAGVGIGTLYRHFPTRQALIEATYRNQLAILCAVTSALIDDVGARDALRNWMGMFVSYLTNTCGMAEALRSEITGDGSADQTSHALVLGAVTTLMSEAVSAGVIRKDVQPQDLLTSLSGLSLVAASQAQSDRLLDLMMDGLRYRV
jgi:AcrR family transcriptional regulator